MNFIKKIKPVLSFQLGKNPLLDKKKKNFRDYIPEPFSGVVIISADFELAWAWRFAKETEKNPILFIEKAQRERNNVPIILKLCEKYNIPITWATVGHLFLESCECINGTPHPELKRPNHFSNKWWNFTRGDWLQHDPCTSLQKNPDWYAPDLIKLIKESSVQHEIACHTFSHIDCSDDNCRPELLESELSECKKQADKYNIELKSFVFPAHTMGNYDILSQNAYKCFRSNFTNTLGYPVLHNSGLWELKATMDFELNPLWSLNYNLYRYKKIMKETIRRNAVCNFWFHPSFSEIFLNRILPEIFKFLDGKRDKLWITTMSDYTEWVNNNV